MFRVNVNGVVLVMDDDGLFDLLQEIKSMLKGVIVRCRGGYVVDSLGHQSIMVFATRIDMGSAVAA